MQVLYFQTFIQYFTDAVNNSKNCHVMGNVYRGKKNFYLILTSHDLYLKYTSLSRF